MSGQADRDAAIADRDAAIDAFWAAHAGIVDPFDRRP